MAGFIGMALLMILVRLRATQRPITTRRIILAPLGMSTGFLMFLYPPTHIPLLWAIISFFIGVLFLSFPLIRSTKFRISGNQIYLAPSKAFVFDSSWPTSTSPALAKLCGAISFAGTDSFCLLYFGLWDDRYMADYHVYSVSKDSPGDSFFPSGHKPLVVRS